METRLIQETKIYILVMNMMRSSNYENSTMVAYSFGKLKLIDWYLSQKCECYQDPFPEFDNPDKKYSKHFQKGSPLEWYNILNDFTPNHYGHGIQEFWINDEQLNNIKTKDIIEVD
jgi:hypothetical protein